MDAAASTIVHRYRRLLFPSPRPPVPLVRPLGPLLPLLTVGDLLFSKKKHIPIRVISIALTPWRQYTAYATNGIAAFERHFPPFVLYARDRRISRESGHKNESGPQPVRPRLFARSCLDLDNHGLVSLLLWDFQFPICSPYHYYNSVSLFNISNLPNSFVRLILEILRVM